MGDTKRRRIHDSEDSHVSHRFRVWPINHRLGVCSETIYLFYFIDNLPLICYARPRLINGDPLRAKGLILKGSVRGYLFCSQRIELIKGEGSDGRPPKGYNFLKEE